MKTIGREIELVLHRSAYQAGQTNYYEASSHFYSTLFFTI